jgi:hypothetical protein
MRRKESSPNGTTELLGASFPSKSASPIAEADSPRGGAIVWP